MKVLNKQRTWDRKEVKPCLGIAKQAADLCDFLFLKPNLQRYRLCLLLEQNAHEWLKLESPLKKLKGTHLRFCLGASGAQVAVRVRELTTQQVARVVVEYAKAGHASPAVFDAVRRDAVLRSGDFEATDLGATVRF